MMLKLLCVIFSFSSSLAALANSRQECPGPLEPGQPGGAWTSEELRITRQKVEKLMDWQTLAAEAGDESWLEGTPLSYEALKNTTLWEYTQDIDKSTLIPREEVEVTAETVDDYGNPITITYSASESEDDYKKDILKWEYFNLERYLWTHRGPRHSRLIQLAFHDCLKYADEDGGGGGCDGCINWSEMGWTPPKLFKDGFKTNEESTKEDPFTSEESRARWDRLHESWPVSKHTNNNKLQMAARTLELIFESDKNFNWPPGTESFECSLRNSGKSRADLWAFAGQVGLERAISFTNTNCKDEDPTGNMEFQLGAIDGIDQCLIKIREREYLPFTYGRVDCIPDEDKKWTPYPFEATKKENHANAYGTGKAIIDALGADFDLSAAESISLMAVHGLASFGSNFEHLMKYRWIGGSRKTQEGINERSSPASFSNMYYKILNGKFYKHMMKKTSKQTEDGLMVGDANGNPVEGGGWILSCRAAMNRTEGSSRERIPYHGGPCHFRPTKVGCAKQADPDMELRKTCFKGTDDEDEADLEVGGKLWKRVGGHRCKKSDARLVEREGKRGVFQIGGPPLDEHIQECKTSFKAFAMPYEVGFVLDFKVDDDNIPMGCAQLNEDWDSKKWFREASPIPAHMFASSKVPEEDHMSCGRPAHAVHVDTFAEDGHLWQKTFFTAWEKILKNGYTNLEEAPAEGHLKIQD